MQKFKVGIVGATGMVGQRFLTLLADHPWFEVVTLAASPRSAGRTYAEAVSGRWAMSVPAPEKYAGHILVDASDIEAVTKDVDFVFCAVDMPKDQIRALEEAYAKAETPVVSNNSANRYQTDVPMMIPECNPEHMAVIPMQRARLGTKRGFIAAKPNCSIQSYVPALTPLRDFGIEKISVCTYQAISGAGKTFERWPEMIDNVIPYIGGEELKSEIEPLKIWGALDETGIQPAKSPVISAQCYRVAVSDGHMAAVSVQFKEKPSMDEMKARWAAYKGLPQQYKLPSAPEQFLTYFEEPDRPQSRLDRNVGNGMGVCIGRLREDPLFDYRFACLSHNTLRGAAGGAVLTAELLCHEGWIEHK